MKIKDNCLLKIRLDIVVVIESLIAFAFSEGKAFQEVTYKNPSKLCLLPSKDKYFHFKLRISIESVFSSLKLIFPTQKPQNNLKPIQLRLLIWPDK